MRFASLIGATTAAMIAAPALAVSVSNLDEVAHYVVFEETRGSKLIREVKPGQTIHSAAITGEVYLRDKPEFSLWLQETDRLAIWPGGELQLQMRQNSRRGSN